MDTETKEMKKRRTGRRKRTVLFAAAAAFLFSAAGAAPAAAGPADDIGMVRPYQGDVNRLSVAEDASQLIIVIGHPRDSSKGNLTWYCRGEDGLLRPVLSVRATNGQNGISEEKVEGDRKTPAGVYHFSMAFGAKEDPGALLPYHQIRLGDYYVNDGNSRYYNRLVNDREVEKDWASAEDLMQEVPQYNYGLVLDYNSECIPGKGSAIFLHCPKAVDDGQTGGCISIPEEEVKKLLCSVDKDTKIVLVPQASELESRDIQK